MKLWGGVISLYVFLLANIPFILSKAIPVCVHLWSIAVEEQFYLFWPYFFKKIFRSSKAFNNLIIIIGTSIIIRFLLWYFLPFKFITVLLIVNRFDCMLFGGVIAICLFYKNKFLPILQHYIAQFFAWSVIFLFIFNTKIINSGISMELATLATGIIIIGQINKVNHIINLENNFFRFLGKYSYGIYVYHPLLIFLFSKVAVLKSIDNEILRMGFIFFLILTSTILIAVLSYELFENKFIKLKHNFSVIHSSNTNIDVKSLKK